jgi:hypothetical protein
MEGVRQEDINAISTKLKHLASSLLIQNLVFPKHVGVTPCLAFFRPKYNLHSEKILLFFRMCDVLEILVQWF